MERSSPRLANDQDMVQIWRSPLINTIKVNWDASTHSQLNRTEFGAIYRDTVGDVLAGGSLVRESLLAPALAEAMIALFAVNLALDLGFKNVVFEGDAASIVTAINGGELNLHVWSLVVMEIKRLVQYFTSWKFIFAKRSANMAAHKMARYSFHTQGLKVWIEDTPLSVPNVVQMDKISCNQELREEI
ncbi:uncharacterized protein LOC120010499 [Tripterygium wilfordii]|uniref:uncharacterized protein LOC120010499 n=1 Tax=Tripterygium wilfordii TaxID=458696 RepID=UPI0018F84BEC|nr:uncharacterized protein LOC120010499 [Tripterygium wilfordii]